MGTIQGFCASTHANAICAGVAFFLSANWCSKSKSVLLAMRASSVYIGKKLRIPPGQILYAHLSSQPGTLYQGD